MVKKTEDMENLGQHILLDLYDCKNADKTCEQLDVFEKALKEGNFTVLNSQLHQFEPQGVSGVFILAESHLSFHIWAELNIISLDVYWCGAKCDEQKLINKISSYFEPQSVDFKYFKRGFVKQ